MAWKSVWLRSLVIVTVLGTALAGCATMHKSEAMDTERLLAASGFKMVDMDTPEKLEHVKSLIQRKIIPHDRKGTTYYVYADANSCKCLYIGTEKAYHSYWKAVKKKHSAEVNWDLTGQGR